MAADFFILHLHFPKEYVKIYVCRYSIAVITSVSQTEEAGSTPVICSSKLSQLDRCHDGARRLAHFYNRLTLLSLTEE